MRLSLTVVAALLLMLVTAPPSLFAQEKIPRCVTVEPMSGKAGTELVVTGENLDKTLVAEFYFTDGKNDIKVPMIEQTETTIKVKIPPNAKVGIRYRLMILTRGKEPKLIEQPVRVEVEE